MVDSLALNVGLFIVAAVAIAFFGIRITKIADRLADKTGLGEAIVGALFLGAVTSLPGIITSVSAAANGYPELSISNALGGIAAQTAFLAIADIVYPAANLEHAAASAANLSQGTLLVSLLAFPLLAASAPPVSIFGIHPISLVLPIAYIFGLRLISKAKETPMWSPEKTPETYTDDPDTADAGNSSLTKLGISMAVLAVAIGTAGYVVAQTGSAIADQSGLSQTVVGGLFTAVTTSLPELVTAIAAVRQGALGLAVGGIIGGNSFDVLFVAFSDFAYRPGSIYHALTSSQTFIIALTILMTGTLLLGLLRREKHGIANIGFESLLILFLYLGGFALLFLTS
ncbi:sodium:calcium antiporter [Oscillatoria sp. CS-180]|uniref:sodium:calcium antiporter n=1 Tax=Oscillatoria sp. CS-180 TaxID=3021720 RepID=UPI00232F2A9A|nr:sodium:calcium antiporter [Oscillatoria sp. CS-180]MDB9524718.1 sodium:calcium antiporter [Oscillatoria sp. CS-180]